MSASSSAIQATTGEPWRASGKDVHTVATQSVIAPERDDVVHGGAKTQLRRLAGGAWSLCAVHPPGQHTKEPVFVDTTEPQLSEAALGHTDVPQSCYLLDETRGEYGFPVKTNNSRVCLFDTRANLQDTESEQEESGSRARRTRTRRGGRGGWRKRQNVSSPPI